MEMNRPYFWIAIVAWIILSAALSLLALGILGYFDGDERQALPIHEMVARQLSCKLIGHSYDPTAGDWEITVECPNPNSLLVYDTETRKLYPEIEHDLIKWRTNGYPVGQPYGTGIDVITWEKK